MLIDGQAVERMMLYVHKQVTFGMEKDFKSL